MNKHRRKNENMSQETENQEIEAVPEVGVPLPESEETADALPDESAAKIADLEKQVAELKDLYLRAQAEMENLRRRTQAELEKRSKYAIASFASDLLPVGDNLKRALTAIPQEEQANSAVKNVIVGLEMTQKDLKNALEKNGIRPVDSVGKVFDPNYHKVVQEVEDPSKPAGTIVQEWQTGYTIGDRVLREAVVVVSKGGPVAGAKAGHTVDTSA